MTRPLADGWRALPALMVATLPLLAGAVLVIGCLRSGALLAALLVAWLTGGPCCQLLFFVAAATTDGEAPPLRRLPRLLREAADPGLRLAAPVAVAAALVGANLLALDSGPAAPFTVSLGLNLAALGSVLMVAPFAFAAGTLRGLSAATAWRAGAGVAAAQPRAVIGGLAALVLIVTAARLAGPGLLLLVPAPAALAACAATTAALGRP